MIFCPSPPPPYQFCTCPLFSSKITILSKYIFSLSFCMFVFLFESNKRQQGGTDLAQIVGGIFFWKSESDPKKEETDQQTESLKLFLKTGNWPKKKRKRTKKNGKRIKCKYSGNRPKIFGNSSTLSSFRGISDNSWKKKETDPNSLMGPIPCWGVSIAL